MSGIFNTIGNAVNNVRETISSTIYGFSQPAQVGTNTNTFLQANSLIAKFAFIILIIFAFLFLLNLGISFISYLLSPPSNPYLIYGLADGGAPRIITQDPSQDGSVYLARSNNQDGGIEFTWSIWLYINDIANYEAKTPGSTTTQGKTSAQFQHIFNKGDGGYDSNNVAIVNNSPGVYLSTDIHPENGAQLMIIMDTLSANDNNNTILINNIPIKKWFHLTVRVKNTVLDAYINGVIAQRLLLTNLPRQNYESVHVSQQGGFTGSISNMRYYQHALNVFEINNIVNYGPNLNVASGSSGKKGDYHYLSKSWYYYNQ